MAVQVRGGEVQDVPGAGQQESLHPAEQKHHTVVTEASEGGDVWRTL